MKLPDEFTRERNRNLPVFIGQPNTPGAKCVNCGDRGIITAFYCDHPLSARDGAPPHPPKGKVVSFINNGWWIGEHRTATCPVCRGDPDRNRQPTYVPMPDELRPGFIAMTKRLTERPTRREVVDELQARQPVEDELVPLNAGS